MAGRVADFTDDQRRLCEIDDKEIMVFRHRDKFYAFENMCVHMGGPVGEGMIIGKVEAVVSPDRCSVTERFSDTEFHIVCPWHGWEYDIDTGQAAAVKTARLNRYETVVRDGDVYVRT